MKILFDDLARNEYQDAMEYKKINPSIAKALVPYLKQSQKKY